MRSDALESSSLADDSATLTDELTQLCNRQGFLVAGAQLLQLCGRCNPCAFLMCLKIEHLSFVNRTFGPGSGDLLLARTARLLRAVFRPPALIGRVSPDEFAVLASVLRPSDCATLLARLNEGVDASNASRRSPILTVSGGFSQFDARHAGGIAERMAQAHNAMCEERNHWFRSLN